jgi:hypothetical protein
MLNLSRVPRKKKQKKAAATTAKPEIPKRKRRRRRHETILSSLPIPSFDHDSSELKRMEREFLGEESDESEVDLMNSSLQKTKTPIPDFSCVDNEEDDEDDIFALPIFQTKKDKSNSSCPTKSSNAKGLSMQETESTSSDTATCNSKVVPPQGNNTMEETPSHIESARDAVTTKLATPANAVAPKTTDKRQSKELPPPEKDNLDAFPSEQTTTKETQTTTTTTTTTSPRNLSYQPVNESSPCKLNQDESSLFPEIDALYAQSDKENVTVKSFYKILEKKIGQKLNKISKQTVRSRLMDLVNGCVLPEVPGTAQEVSRPSAGPTETSTTNAQDDPIQDSPKHQNQTNENAETPQKSNNQKAKSAQTKQPQKRKNTGTGTHTAKASEGKIAEATKPLNSQTAAKESDSDICMIIEPQNSVLPPKDAEDDPKPKKRTRRATARKGKHLQQVQNETDQKPAPAPRGRKRARKGTCALCTTCSCQKPQGDETGAMLDMKTFARSDVAIEKALIRRLKKTEKSSEHLEGQTEMVRRKLKKHRRDVQRKKMKTAPQDETRAYFLPEEEEFESLQNESTKVPDDWVQQAQQRMFPIVPSKCSVNCLRIRYPFVLANRPNVDHQQTLTQLGFPSTKSTHSNGTVEAEENGHEGQEGVNVTESVEPTEPTDAAEDSDADDEEAADDVLVEPPAAEPEVVDKIHRFHWSKGVKAESHEGDVIQSQSVWGALAKIQEEQEDDEDGIFALSQPIATSKCPWDRLFSESTNSREEVDEGGIEQLLDLLDGASAIGRQIEPSNKENASPHNEAADLSMLSQGGKEAANQVYASINGDLEKVSALNQVCPNWRENVSYAFVQKDEGDIQKALENLRESRSKMMEIKRKILEAWGRQKVALDVLETALESSLGHLKPQVATSASTTQVGAQADGGFLTQPASSQTEESHCRDD